MLRVVPVPMEEPDHEITAGDDRLRRDERARPEHPEAPQELSALAEQYARRPKPEIDCRCRCQQ